MTGQILTIPAAEYHDDPCDQPSLSASMARILLSSSPAHARAAHPRLNPDYQRQAESKFDIGTAAHALLLEGENAVQVIYADDWRTKDAKEQRDLARAHGRIPLLADQWTELEEMVEAIRAQLATFDATPALFTDGLPEQTLVWQEDGVPCRARLDWLHTDHTAIDDLKTTSRTANPDGFSRSLFNIGYDVQAAFYRRGVKACVGIEPEFRFVVAETFPPYAISVVGLTPAALALADAKVDRALDTWKRCLETDRWPAYPTRVCYAEPPGWAEAAWLEREGREEGAA